jgi:hypothetical protein
MPRIIWMPVKGRDGKLNLITAERFGREKLEKENTVFIFPGNMSHHTDH